ncbi:hypothetical protein ASPZODRAFT_148787 [Penicilliopsis zonata CBS 506.65]|uniref:DUF1765-domain-containing protein n=1 Tax=Penicilliopsis zonata CBS 506.65 TaxID=1073090 RepID=A0A1L9SWE4_9EURO|nr:hypothetical protein ASPZODRAFT_148787 [Penicilliopsis zonata CBS 506.65]OJJ51520.1 hypothetical protein ASPZODRAFT_148787 [Penicilliopsis zonata CBS 506.65]
MSAAPSIMTAVAALPLEADSSALSRAASYNNLPDLPATEPGSPGLRRTFSDQTFPSNPEAPSPSKETVAAGKDILRRTSLRAKNKTATVAVSHFTLSSAEDVSTMASGSSPDQPANAIPETRAPEPVARPTKARSMSGRLAHLARKPWISSSSSRSPSPSAKITKRRPFSGDDQSPTRLQTQFLENPVEPADGTDESPTPARKRTILYKRPRRPTLAVIAQESNPSTPNSPTTSNNLRTKNSLERFTASLNVSTPVLPPMPKAAAATAAAFAGGIDPVRKKDELWGVFRGLEADYQKFQTKSSALKANVIRSSLLPFLSRHQLHTSCKSLRPEDLDRRVNILNKWWTGLLEMLNGKNNQSISGTDRPVYLEAVVGIMTRPEWRIPFPAAQSATQSNGSMSNPLDHTSTSVSETSEGSSGSEFLIESIHHNIRNLFVQNLLSQMAFVVERMSMRHAPASLVAFCGKACAYAFFFCPGVADILVRLWNTPADIFRRILSESEVHKSINARSFAQELAFNFPPALRTLSFHSHASLVRYLRRKPDVPLNASQIPWQSPWVSRWSGRDTDLFFVFVKYIHILFADAIPPSTEKSHRILAPGLLPVHSQLLVVLEDTLYKQSAASPSAAASAENSSHSVAAITFDDFIEGADASVSALPLGTANSHRSMAENRLVILLRDFLSESSVEPNRARLFYAESFCSVMKAGARKTSLFDHNACFLLCDFIEEVIPILTRYAQSIESELFDWKFWLVVCRQMMQSHNSLTEIRVFSFLFGIWNTWVATEERKGDVCLGVLLDEPFFYHYFNHWSPMVRAYFHRLLCWRVARFNGEPTPLDTTIYETLSNRLQCTWAYYLAFQSKAGTEMTAPLSSAPCTPAPGRRIIIIRCDNHLPPNNLFVSFDRVVPPGSTGQPLAAKINSTADLPSSESQPSSQKRRWGLLKSMFGAAKSGESAVDEPETKTLDQTVTSDRCSDGHARSHNGSLEHLRPKTPHQPFSFRFSLEWMDRPQWPSKNKRLYTPSLPVAAQLHVQLRSRPRSSETSTEKCIKKPTENVENEASKNGDDDKVTATEVSATPPPTDSSVSLPELAVPFPTNPLVASKYAGRALAEWAQIVAECDCFFARRRDEGVPSDRMVETPILGVESFRK